MLSNIRYIVLIAMSLLSIYLYYIVYPHPEDRSFFLIYLLIVGVVFGVYKGIQSLVFQRIDIRISHLIYFFLTHLFVVCLCFFAFQGLSFFSGFELFFKITLFLLLLSLLWGVMYALGRSILLSTKLCHFQSKSSESLASLGLGFGVYMMGVFVCGYFGYYSLFVISGWTIFCVIASYSSYSHIWESRKIILKSYKLGDTSQSGHLSLLIDELHFLVLTFVLSINFISVYRPFPIGWDDLGAYMNYPKLLSESGELIALGKMYLFELYTGLGFLAGSQTFAFYLSSFTGVIASIVIYIGLKNLFKDSKTLFDIPLFCVMILMMMPMSVFQLAKDMKLDFGLLAVSSIALFLMYDVLIGKKHFSHKQSLGTLTLIGFIIGIAFSIKVISLLLLLGILGMLFYKKFALGGFLGFFTVFAGIFTQFNLWKLMNVVVPSDGGMWLPVFSFGAIILGIILLIGSYYKKTAGELSGPHALGEVMCVILGFSIALIPWGIKHIGEIPEGKSLTLGTLVSGHAERYIPNYELLYAQDELGIKKTEAKVGIQADGTTSNEDFGRYFGYEGGINNYLKLPFNLSFQLNQKGEFTDISFLFFALIPALFLFLPYRKPEYIYPVVVFMGLLLVYYIPNRVGQDITDIFSLLGLPGGYIAIFAFVFSPLMYLYNTLERKNKGVEIFLITLAFSSIYVFLWAISAFGVVWYGIVMYLSFLILIGSVFHSLEEEGSSDINSVSYLVLGVVGVYIILSVIPHGVTNLKNAGYIEYKLGNQSEETAIFTLHPEYFPMLFAMNIGSQYHQEIFTEYKNALLRVLEPLQGGPRYTSILSGIQTTPELASLIQSLLGVPELSKNKELLTLQQELYTEVIYPRDEIKNTKNIYRVGTFLKYFVSKNIQRLFEDSLLVQFENYIYDENIDIAFERFEKLGISYLLVDLNAATIDNNNVEKLLTGRYEHLLEFLSHKNLKLIETDSICLKIALENYREDENLEKYMSIAAVNYGSRAEQLSKRKACLNQLVKYVQLDNTPNFLNGYKNYMNNESIDMANTDAVAQSLVRFIQPGSKVLFEISK